MPHRPEVTRQFGQTAHVHAGFPGRMARVASRDSYVPLGDAANLVLLSEQQIEDAARALLRR